MRTQGFLAWGLWFRVSRFMVYGIECKTCTGPCSKGSSCVKQANVNPWHSVSQDPKP